MDNNRSLLLQSYFNRIKSEVRDIGGLNYRESQLEIHENHSFHVQPYYDDQCIALQCPRQYWGKLCAVILPLGNIDVRGVQACDDQTLRNISHIIDRNNNLTNLSLHTRATEKTFKTFLEII